MRLPATFSAWAGPALRLSIATVFAFLLLLTTACGSSSDPAPIEPTFGPGARAELIDIEGIADLKQRFNGAEGTPRLVLLLSPT